MRNICSLFFYELLNVIKVSNQIVGKVFLATRVVRRLKGFVGCNSWQSGTGRAERATAGTCYHFQFSSHTELVFVMRAELMRGGLQHEDTAARVKTLLSRSRCWRPRSPDGQWTAQAWLLALAPWPLCQYDRGFPTTLRHDHGHFNCPCFKER